MAKSHGMNLVFKLDVQGGAALKDLTSYTQDVSGLPGSVDLTDVTTGGSTGYKHFQGLHKASFTAKMVFDDATDASWDVVKNFQTDTTTRSFEYGPKGSTATYPKISGECVISSIDFTASPGSANIMTVHFELDNGVTIGTWS